MRNLRQSTFIIFGLLVIGLASSVFNHYASGSSTQNKAAEPAASKVSSTTQNAVQKLYRHTTSNPFEDIHEKNFSNISISQEKLSPDSELDVSSIKAKINSDIENHFKLPIDIPFP